MAKTCHLQISQISGKIQRKDGDFDPEVFLLIVDCRPGK